MTRILLLIIASLTLAPLQAEEVSTLGGLDHIIEATQLSYNNQLQLRDNIAEYVKIQEQYLANPKNKTVLFHLVKKADQVLEGIHENHLAHAFDAKFLEELSMFSRIAKKTNVPKP